MQKTEHFSCIYHLFCSKRCQIKFNTLLNNEDSQQKRITKYCNKSFCADIDYKDFMKIYRECTKEPYSFLTIDTTLLASDPLRFRKNVFLSYKYDSN